MFALGVTSLTRARRRRWCSMSIWAPSGYLGRSSKVGSAELSSTWPCHSSLRRDPAGPRSTGKPRHTGHLVQTLSVRVVIKPRVVIKS